MSIKFINCIHIYIFIYILSAHAYTLNARIPKQPTPKIAVAVTAYNRPNNLKQVINSLEKNVQSHKIPFYFFLDGGPDATQRRNKTIINASKIKNKKIITRNSNYGIGRNTIEARRQMFDELNFDIVFMLEDDCVVSPYYITMLLNLHKWANSQFDNIGIIKGWNPCFLSKEEKANKLGNVTETTNHLWGYCIDKKTWDRIKPILYEYEQKFLLNSTYKNKDETKIKQWFHNKLLFRERRTGGKRKCSSKIDYLKKFLSQNWPAGQDGITYIAHYLAGYISLTTEVNRAINIGKIGTHYNIEQWNNSNFSNVKLDNFIQDKTITEFRLT